MSGLSELWRIEQIGIAIGFMVDTPHVCPSARPWVIIAANPGVVGTVGGFVVSSVIGQSNAPAAPALNIVGFARGVQRPETTSHSAFIGQSLSL
jgi:hypothetical protein